MGLVASTGWPRPVNEKLNRDILKLFDSADMKRFFASMGAEPAHTTSAEFAALIKPELAKWSKVVNEAGADAE